MLFPSITEYQHGGSLVQAKSKGQEIPTLDSGTKGWPCNGSRKTSMLLVVIPKRSQSGVNLRVLYRWEPISQPMVEETTDYFVQPLWNPEGPLPRTL